MVHNSGRELSFMHQIHQKHLLFGPKPLFSSQNAALIRSLSLSFAPATLYVNHVMPGTEFKVSQLHLAQHNFTVITVRSVGITYKKMQIHEKAAVCAAAAPLVGGLVTIGLKQKKMRLINFVCCSGSERPPLYYIYCSLGARTT